MPWSQVYRANGTDIVKHTFDWVSDGAGDAVIVSGAVISGVILRISVIPSTTDVPTDLYDAAMLNSEGIDVFAALGTDLSNTVPFTFCPGTPLYGTVVSVVPVIVDSLLTLYILNAGAAKAGRIVIYVR